MDSGTRLGIGIFALAVAMGGGGYAFEQYTKSKKAGSLTVGLPQGASTPAGQVYALPVSIANPGGATTVAAEATIYSGAGLVTGHFFADPQALAQAFADFSNGNTAAYQQLQLSPAARVAKAQVAAGGQVTLNLYTEPSMVAASETLNYIVYVAVAPTGLIVNDPQGRSLPKVPSGAIGYRGVLLVTP